MSDLAEWRAREAEKRARREAKMAAAIENSEAEASLVPDLSGEIMEGEARLKSHEVVFENPTQQQPQTLTFPPPFPPLT